MTKRQLLRVECGPRARVHRLRIGRQSGKDRRRERLGTLLSDKKICLYTHIHSLLLISIIPSPSPSIPPPSHLYHPLFTQCSRLLHSIIITLNTANDQVSYTEYHVSRFEKMVKLGQKIIFELHKKHKIQLYSIKGSKTDFEVVNWTVSIRPSYGGLTFTKHIITLRNHNLLMHSYTFSQIQ